MTSFYWVGDSGNWDDSAHWSLTSGGSGGAGVPTITDDAYFDTNSFTTTTPIVTVRQGYTNACVRLDMSQVSLLSFSPTLEFFSSSASNSAVLTVGGYTDIPSNVIIAISLASGAFAELIISATGNVSLGADMSACLVQFTGGTIDLSGDLVVGSLFMNMGTFNSNDYAITFTYMDWDANINLGASLLTMVNSTYALPLPPNTPGVITTHAGLQIGVSTPVTLDAGTSYFLIQATNGYFNLLNFGAAGGEVEFYDVEIGATPFYFLNQYAATGDMAFTDSLLIDPGTSVFWESGNSAATFTVSGTFTANGTALSTITLNSVNSGTKWYINSPTNTVTLTYVNVKDSTASGTTPFNAAPGVDQGNNTNWSFATLVDKTVAMFTDLLIADYAITAAMFTDINPQIYIVDVDEITYNSARVQAFTVSTGAGNGVGFVYGTSPTPIVGVDNSKDLTGNLGDSFTTLLGLATGQTYYIRMYTYISSVYSYGAASTFTTSSIVPITVISTDNLVSKYQFLLYDSSGNLIADLGGYISNRVFSITRNRPEEITFSIPLFTLDQLASNLKLTPADFFQAGVQEVLIRRSGVNICAGQIDYWESDFTDPANPIINVKAHGWMSLFSYRIFSGTYTSEDQAYIIRDLITNSQALTNGDYGITLGTTVIGSNSYDSLVYQDKSIYDIMVEMSEEDGGFDFQFTYDKVFNLFLPSQGVTRNDIVFTYPGNMLDIKISVDSTKIVNELLARGAGIVAGLSTTVDDLTSQGTYFLRQGVKDFTDMNSVDQLANSASSELVYYKNPLILNSITYNGLQNNTPIVGSYSVGDKIRVFASSLPLYGDLDQSFTIDAITVTLGLNDEESVQLDLAVPT